MNKKSVLFVCIHNSARSQMAEALLKKYASHHFEAESAGIEPGTLNPLIVDILKEINIDISGKKTRAVSDLLKAGKTYDYVITVCDETSAERCPAFPGKSQRLHWGFKDPSQFKGSLEERLKATRAVRNEIDQKIKDWLSELKISKET